MSSLRPVPDHKLTLIGEAVGVLNRIILGKEQQVRLALSCLLANGHLLIEDIPGMGKTTLAHGLAKILGLDFERIQFTSDLLPADVLGVSVYEKETSRFTFHPGPIFAQLVLVDEINRATPKTQSALLEAMEERQVTVEGESRPLPKPFFVIATENPAHQVGTFPLPESQLDRFLMRIRLGYPGPQAERQLLKGPSRQNLLKAVVPVLSADMLQQMQDAVSKIHVSDALLDYVQALLGYTRRPGAYHSGLSPRAGLALKRAAQAWALLANRDHAVPEDVQAVFPAVATHRLRAQDAPQGNGDDFAQQIITDVPVK
ncbi:MAG: AAA family ATPase [Gammaproteobacteria bacterium]